MRILVVEPDAFTRRMLAASLCRDGHAVDGVASAAAADATMARCTYDALVVEPELPDEEGLASVERWRDEGVSCPVLILSRRNQPEDRIDSLNAGADDHLDKPFHEGELLARMAALLRRRHKVPIQIVEAGGIVLDRTFRQASAGGRPLPLTPRELALLEVLMLHAGCALSRAQLAEHVSEGSQEQRSNVIDVLVGRIRRKLERVGHAELVATVRGTGYSFVPSQPTGAGSVDALMPATPMARVSGVC